MELYRITGNTYYIQAPTNIGVFVFENGNCLLIDTGFHDDQAKEIDEVLSLNSLYPRYIINTHGHPDHCGGNHYFCRKYKDIIVGASGTEKFYMENPEYHAAVLNLAGTLTAFNIRQPGRIDMLLDSGTYKIDGNAFEIIPLEGHSLGQIGIITPERVCFLGDAIFSESLIEQFSLLYLFDIEDSLRTMIRLKDVDADFFVLGHHDRVLNRVEFAKLCDVNLRNLERIKEQILTLLERPAGREDILRDFVIQNNINLTLKEYSIIFFTLTVFLKYLSEQGFIDCYLDNGKLYYYKKI